MRRVLIVLLGSGVIAGFGAGSASAGQPSADCADVAVASQPPGFQTDGFATAEANYAGTPETHSADNANSDNAVSQYDIACVRKAAH